MHSCLSDVRFLECDPLEYLPDLLLGMIRCSRHTEDVRYSIIKHPPRSWCHHKVTFIQNEKFREKVCFLFSFQLLEPTDGSKVGEVLYIENVITLFLPLIDDLLGIGNDPYLIQRKVLKVLLNTNMSRVGLSRRGRGPQKTPEPGR